MKMFTYIIDGEPVAQQRPRFSNKHTYDPQESLKTEVSWSLKYQHMKQNSFQGLYLGALTNPLYVSFEFHMTIPKSVSKAKKAELLHKPHLKKKDLDNMCKFYMDAGNAVLWHDDSLIYRLDALKFYSDTPRTVIVAREMEADDLDTAYEDTRKLREEYRKQLLDTLSPLMERLART